MEYRKMSLFDAPEGSIIAHACNAQGVWGSGIARAFKEMYPKSYEEYHHFCTKLFEDDRFNPIGKSVICQKENGHSVLCFITSDNFGLKKDNENAILIQTTLALYDFFRKTHYGHEIYCNKFNSGLFGVPWEKTEAILKYFENRYKTNFIVCDPDLEE